MKTILRYFGVMITTLLVAGCATTYVQDKAVDVVQTKTDTMAEVGIQVVDKHAESTDTQTQSALLVQHIVTSEGWLNTYTLSLESMLRDHNFVSVPYRIQLHRRLMLTITHLAYANVTQSLFDGSKVTGTIIVDAVNGKGTYHQTYSGVATAGFGSQDVEARQAVNHVLHDLLQKLSNDKALIHFLR